MLKLELNNEEYKLPTSFAEVNIDLYERITEVIETEKDKVDRMVSLISVITGIRKEDIKSIDMAQIGIINHHLEYMFKKQEYPLKETFEIDGITYGLNKDLGKISFGEYIDLESFSNGTKSLKDLHILMAILYRPVTSWEKHKIYNWIFKGLKSKSAEYTIEKYVDESVIERSKLFKERMTMDIVWGAMFFFILLSVAYTLHLKGYSEQEVVKKMKEMMEQKNQ